MSCLFEILLHSQSCSHKCTLLQDDKDKYLELAPMHLKVTLSILPHRQMYGWNFKMHNLHQRPVES